MRLYDQPASTVAMFSHLDNTIFWACSARNFEQQWSGLTVECSLMIKLGGAVWVPSSSAQLAQRGGWNTISTLLQLFSNDIKVARRWANGIARGCLLPVFHFLTIIARVALQLYRESLWPVLALARTWKTETGQSAQGDHDDDIFSLYCKKLRISDIIWLYLDFCIGKNHRHKQNALGHMKRWHWSR